MAADSETTTYSAETKAMFDPVEALKKYVSFASVSTDPAYRDGMTGARVFISDLLRETGFSVEECHTPLHPVILAERGGDSNWPHVVIYGHYDVQPPDPFEKWISRPFEAEIRGDRIFGRGAADNKGPLLVHVAAVSRLFEKNPDFPLRITFLIEGEEEIGSPSFSEFLGSYGDRLRGDFVMLSDTVSPSADQIVITTGLRGVVCLEAIVTGPKMDLHSGIHGGVLLNPIQALTEVCSSLHNADGSINVPGFYDDVVEFAEWERAELTKMDWSEADYADFLGIETFHTASGISPFQAIRFGPTLEFNGIGGGYTGEGTKTVIPSKAFAKISCRLVPNQDPIEIAKLVIKTIRERCSPKVSMEIIEGHCGAPYLVVPPEKGNTTDDLPPNLARAFKAAYSAIDETFGKEPLYLREGGSIPIIADLKSMIGLDSLMIGLSTPDDSLHAPNESFHLGVFEKGIASPRGFLTN